MEFCGGTDKFDTSIDLRHVALIVAASVIAFLLRTSWARMRAEATGVRDLRRQMSLTLRGFPYGGRGLRFGILTASITTLIQASAQASERDTTRFHDVIGWLIITLLVSALAAVVAHVIIRAEIFPVGVLVSLISAAPLRNTRFLPATEELRR